MKNQEGFFSVSLREWMLKPENVKFKKQKGEINEGKALPLSFVGWELRGVIWGLVK